MKGFPLQIMLIDGSGMFDSKINFKTTLKLDIFIRNMIKHDQLS